MAALVDFGCRYCSRSDCSKHHYYPAILAIAPATLFLFSDDRLYRLASAVCWTAAITFIAWTGSRAAILGLSLACVIAMVFTLKSAPVTRWYRLVLSAFGGIGMTAFLPNPDPVYGVMRMMQGSLLSAPDPSSGRIEIWKLSWENILQQPWLGHQAGIFNGEMLRWHGLDIDNPHNFLLQYFYDWGFVGGSAIIVLLAALGVAVFRRRQHSALLVFPAIAGTTMLLSIGLVEGMLYHPLKMLLVTALIAPLLARNRLDQSVS